MSTTIPASEPTNTDPVEEIDPAPVDPGPVDPAPEHEEGQGKEAAKYRRKLREVEKERDDLAAQLADTRGAIVGLHLKGGPVTRDALTAAGHDLDSLLDEHGQVDPELVRAASRDTAKRFGIQTGPVAPREGYRPENTGGGTSWADVLSGPRSS